MTSFDKAWQVCSRSRSMEQEPREELHLLQAEEQLSEDTECDECDVVTNLHVGDSQQPLFSPISTREDDEINEVREQVEVVSLEEDHVVVEPKLPIWRLAALCTVGGAIDLGFAVLGGYAAPLVVAAGLELEYASLVLVLSPIMGLLFQIYLGALSDKCKCRWGRRRPFILLFALTACLGMIFAPLAPRVASAGSTTVLKSLSVILTVGFLIVFDFSNSAMQLPSRAYLLDVTPASQTQLGNFVYSGFIGLGSLLGYILGGINWSFVFGTKPNIVNQAQVIFIVIIALYMVSLLLTILSVKEKSTVNLVTDSNTCCCTCGSLSSFLDTIKDMLSFIYCMSKHMWLLWLTCLFGSFAVDVYLFFFTTFVGEAVYGGVSNAPVNSPAYQHYTEGVRMGSIALAISSALLMFVALVMNPLANKIGLKTLFIAFQYIFVVCCFAMTIFHQVPVVLVLGAFYGPYIGMFLSVPFQLISLYNVSHLVIRTCSVIWLECQASL